MAILAFACGFALGAAQYFLLREILRLGLARQNRFAWPLTAKLVIYLAAAAAAVFLFPETLLYAGIGLGTGILVLAVVFFVRAVRRQARSQAAHTPPFKEE